jgi:hypothetical protein
MSNIWQIYKDFAEKLINEKIILNTMIRTLILILAILLVGCAPTHMEELTPIQDQDAVPEVVEEPVEEPGDEESVKSEVIVKEIPLPKELAAKDYITINPGVYKDYVLRLEGVSEGICGVNVDGTTHWIEEGDTRDIGRLTVYVHEVIVSHSVSGEGDMCEVSLHTS